MTTIIVLCILIIFVLILLLVIGNTIAIKVGILLDGGSSDESSIADSPEFQSGMNHAFSLVQLSLFKMWKDSEILDFDNINTDIKQTLNKITKTSETFNELQKQFIDYLKEKGEDSND